MFLFQSELIIKTVQGNHEHIKRRERMGSSLDTEEGLLQTLKCGPAHYVGLCGCPVFVIHQADDPGFSLVTMHQGKTLEQSQLHLQSLERSTQKVLLMDGGGREAALAENLGSISSTYLVAYKALFSPVWVLHTHGPQTCKGKTTYVHKIKIH